MAEAPADSFDEESPPPHSDESRSPGTPSTNDGAVMTALRQVAEIVSSWREAGRTTTTAGVKPALQKATQGGFDERLLGFASFREFLQRGEELGVVQLRQLPAGHWLVLLPGESVDEVPSPNGSPNDASTEFRSDTEQVRLKLDVWTAFVEWHNRHRRLWDREESRAFSFPVATDGEPEWVRAPDRFVEIPSADQAVQIEWMRAWAQTLPTNHRKDVQEALDEGVPAGQFSRTLQTLGLTGAWRMTLQRRIATLVLEWAEREGVEPRALIDSRPKRTPRVTSARPAKGTSRPPDTAVELLRTRLHETIDAMSLQDLSRLSIPAEYLSLRGSAW